MLINDNIERINSTKPEKLKLLTKKMIFRTNSLTHSTLGIKKDKFNTDSSEGIKIITACSRIISAINKNKLKIKYHGKR